MSQIKKNFPWIAGLVGTGLGTFAMLSRDNTTQMAAATSVADIIAKNIEVPIFIAHLPFSTLLFVWDHLDIFFQQESCRAFINDVHASDLVGKDPAKLARAFEDQR
jgi:hypothetical protein